MSPTPHFLPSFVLFDEFVERLREQGFVIGVDTHLRLLRLLNELPPHTSQKELKYLLCPLFAHTPEQQDLFYEQYNAYFEQYRTDELPTKTLVAEDKFAHIASTSLHIPEVPKKSNYVWVTLGSFVLLMSICGWYLQRSWQVDIPKEVMQRQESIPQPFNNTAPKVVEEQVPQQVVADIKQTPEIPPNDNLLPAAYPSEITLAIDDLWVTNWSVYFNYICLGLVLLLPILLLAYRYYRYKKDAFLSLQQIAMSDEGDSYFQLSFPKQKYRLFQTAHFKTIAQRLHQREWAVGKDLHIDQSISATIEAGGRLQLSYQQRSRPVEYLILLPNQPQGAHDVRWLHELVESLQQSDLYCVVYYYDHDILRVYQQANKQENLATLHGRYPRHRLLIFGAATLFFGADALPNKAMYEINLWQYRALLSNTPIVEWSELELRVAEQMPLLPASLAAIGWISERFEPQQQPPPITVSHLQQSYERLPTTTVLSQKMSHWINQVQHIDSNDSAMVQLLVNELELALPPECFTYLCACAIYTEVQWDLTLALGNVLEQTHTNRRYLSAENLYILSQIIWFRQGYIPDSIREELILRLDEPSTSAILAYLIDLLTQLHHQKQLNTDSIRNDYRAKLLVLQHRATKEPHEKRLLASEIQQLAENSSAVGASSALQHSPVFRSMTIRLPEILRSTFFGNRTYVWRREFVWVTTLLMIFLLSSGVWWVNKQPLAYYNGKYYALYSQQDSARFFVYAAQSYKIGDFLSYVVLPSGEEIKLFLPEKNKDFQTKTYIDYKKHCYEQALKALPNYEPALLNETLLSLDFEQNADLATLDRITTDSLLAKANIIKFSWYCRTEQWEEAEKLSTQIYPDSNMQQEYLKFILEYHKGNLSLALGHLRIWLKANPHRLLPNQSKVLTILNAQSNVLPPQTRKELSDVIELIMSDKIRQILSTMVFVRTTERSKPQKFSFNNVNNSPSSANDMGGFEMGCAGNSHLNCNTDEFPRHYIHLNSFEIGRYEVTQEQWRAVMGSLPPKLTLKCETCPITSVSWNDVQDFIQRLNTLSNTQFRLPTEAEWEYAASYGSRNSVFPSASDAQLSDIAWYVDNADSRPQKIGKKNPNNLQLYDMAGNASEWCADWYSATYYQDMTDFQNPKGATTGQYKVKKGGSWANRAGNCRYSKRDYAAPDEQNAFTGFRLAR